MLCISSTTQIRRSRKFFAYSLAEHTDPHPGPCCSLTSNRGLSKPEVQARISETPKHREFMTCCSSPKVSSTGTKSQTQAPKTALPTPRCVCQHSCSQQSFFTFLLFLPDKAETVSGLKSYVQVLIQAPQPAASHHSAAQELLFSLMGVLPNKHSCQLGILTLSLSPLCHPDGFKPTLTPDRGSDSIRAAQPTWVTPSLVFWAGFVLPGTARNQAPRKHPENT